MSDRLGLEALDNKLENVGLAVRQAKRAGYAADPIGVLRRLREHECGPGVRRVYAESRELQASAPVGAPGKVAFARRYPPWAVARCRSDRFELSREGVVAIARFMKDLGSLRRQENRAQLSIDEHKSDHICVVHFI